MFWLIDTDKQIDYLVNKSYDKAFVEVIPYSYQEHPSINNICAIYIRPLDETKGFMLPISHSETISIGIDKVNRILNGIKNVYVRDKKEFLHYFILKACYDITLHSPPYIRELQPIYNWFYKRHPEKKDINKIIPIVKHYEQCEIDFENLKNNINGECNLFFNNKATVVFNAIEKSGLQIDKNKFNENFHLSDSSLVYTQYNFKTLTRRPSNRFKGVNYAALDKGTGVREAFISRNDLLLEVDISAYHPTLLAKLIGYKFECEDIHEEFSKMYGVDYKKAKELTFKQLYGGVFSQYEDLEFFKLTTKYVGELWEKFQSEGYIEVPISKYKFYRDKLEDMTPQKLLNYLLQSLETAMNVYLMWEMLKLLRGKNTKLELYTYDSFLFDVDMDEIETIKEILGLFKKNGLRVKKVRGENYGNME